MCGKSASSVSSSLSPRPRRRTNLGALCLLLAATPLTTPAATTTTTSSAFYQTPINQTAKQSGALNQASSARDNSNTATAASSSSAQRAAAYAKLLEGQRYMVLLARTGNNADSGIALEKARQAFEAARNLDPNFAEAAAALAEVSFYLSRLDVAERQAKEAVRLDANNIAAHRLLSRLYALQSNLSQGRIERATAERAIAELREVVRLNPNDTEANYLLGEIYQAMGRDGEAIDAFRRVASGVPPVDTRFIQIITGRRDISPDDTYLRLAEVLLRSGRNAEAVDFIGRALAADSENARVYDLISNALLMGKPSDARPLIVALEKIVAANPDNINAALLLARHDVRENRTDAAANKFRAVIAKLEADKTENAQQLFQVQLELAGTFAEAQRFDDAREIYEKMLSERKITNQLVTERDNRSIASYVLSRLGELERRAGREREANQAYARMRAVLGNDDPTPDLYLIESLRSQGNRQEALAAVRAARARFPDNVELQRQEAAALADVGQVDAGIAILRNRLKNTPADQVEYLLIAQAYLQAGRAREAIDAARKAVEIKSAARPDLTTQGLLLLSSAQERAGDFKASEESLRTVIKQEPDNATALNNLGYFLVERNERLEEAIDLIERALRLQPTNGSFLDSLGWAYFRLGKLPEAERYLLEAARRNTASATVLEHLGDVYEKLGRPEESRAAWRKALLLTVAAEDSARLKSKINLNARQ